MHACSVHLFYKLFGANEVLKYFIAKHDTFFLQYKYFKNKTYAVESFYKRMSPVIHYARTLSSMHISSCHLLNIRT